MKNEIDEIGFGFPAVGVGKSRKQSHFGLINSLKLFHKQSLNRTILLEQFSEELHQSIDEAGTGVETEARYDLMDGWQEVIVVSFYLNYRLDDIEVGCQNLGVSFDLFLVVDTAGTHMFETAIAPVVLIDDEIYDVFYIENVETVLDLLEVKPLDEIEIVLKDGDL